MVKICDVGETSVSSKGVNWTIPNFIDLPQISETVISGPSFSIGSRSWVMSVYPNGSLFHSSVGWFGIAANDCHPRAAGEFIVELSITDGLQEKIVSSRADVTGDGWYVCKKLIRRSDFDLSTNQILRTGNLHILLNILNEEGDSIFDAVSNTVENVIGERCNKRSLSMELFNQHEGISGRNELERKKRQKRAEHFKEVSIDYDEDMRKIYEKKPICIESCINKTSEMILDKKGCRSEGGDAFKEASTQTYKTIWKRYEQKLNFIESYTQTEETSGNRELRQNDDASKEISTQTDEGMGIWKLKQDIENMVENRSYADVILTVQDKKIRFPKFILGARSPVFLSLFNKNTEEAITIVNIGDVDSNAFHSFLDYLYTGNVKNLTPEKALKLYSIANKYEVNELKQTCVGYLVLNISVDNFGDVFALSHKYNEEHLKAACIEFFQEKSLDIIVTSNWQNFLCENPIVGNGLFIKHLQKLNQIINKSEYSKK